MGENTRSNIKKERRGRVVERGKFIVFEGIGGCGKGTQIEKLAKYLRDIKGFNNFIVTREHTRNTPIGELIEKTIKGSSEEMDPVALQLAFTTDRRNHTEKVVRPALMAGIMVIGDRYRDSTTAYAPPDWRGYYVDIQRRVTIKPDVTIFIDLSPKECVTRILKRGDPDVFDKEESLRMKREGYLWCMSNTDGNYAQIDGSGSEDEVHARIVCAIEQEGLI